MQAVDASERTQVVWEAITERCCGLDVHQKTVVACLLVGLLDQQPTESVRTFATKDRGDKGGVLIPDSFMYSHEMVSDPLSERDCFFDAGQHF